LYNGTKKEEENWGQVYNVALREYAYFSRQNLVEKVTAKKMDLTRIIFWENGMCPHFKTNGGGDGCG
jgi:hypothetical protein